jgi:hypothetical protein
MNHGLIGPKSNYELSKARISNIISFDIEPEFTHNISKFELEPYLKNRIQMFR